MYCTGQFTRNDAKAITLLFLNETEVFNFYNLNFFWIDTFHMATQVMNTLCQSGTVVLASKAFGLCNTWPETSPLGTNNYVGQLLMHSL